MLRNFLDSLLRLSSPSGDEECVTELFHDYVAPFVDEVLYDVCGNCIAHKKGSGEKVMLMAHADEVGLMINYIDADGFLYFKEMGGVDTTLFPGQRVRISGIKGDVIGVIGKKPIHLQDKCDESKEMKPENLWIDIAARNKDDAMDLVQIGNTGTLFSEPLYMANDLVACGALDDKIGLMILVGVAQALPQIHTDKDIYLVASVQEELGARGAQTATQKINPEVGVAIDVTHATDYPSMSCARDGDIALNRGVVISHGPNMHKSLNKQFKQLAQDCKISYQEAAVPGPTGSDARAIQQVGDGVKTVLISIPCRYMHTPNEIVSLQDAETAIQLLVKYLQKMSD